MNLNVSVLTYSILLGVYGIMLYYFYYEKFNHNKRLHNIPIRVHVNGTRGKSSVARLIGSILREAGYNVFTKTTGSSARIIHPNGKDQLLKRIKANINEQLDIIEVIAQYNPNVLVIECMAIEPMLQYISESEMIHSTIGVITNVRMDHQDKMGWTLPEIANSLCEFMPSNGYLICGEQNHELIKIIKKRAKEKNTKVIVSKNKLKKEELKKLDKLNYIEHEENVALALEVANFLNIDKSVALDGILNTIPDPGVLRVYKKRINDKLVKFANAHAANDRESVVMIYNMLKKQGIMNNNTKKIGVLYNRYDRPERVDVFADIVTKDLKFDEIILLGHYKNKAKNKLIYNSFSEEKIHVLKVEDLKHLLDLFHKLATNDTIIIGMINIHGKIVEDYINFFHSTMRSGKVVL